MTAIPEPRPRLAILGPLPPFRSGIAQYTMMMARALEPLTELRVVSFTRQYPLWLFPGQTDIDPNTQRLPPPTFHYLLDSLSPRTWRQATDFLLAHRPMALIIPWWTIYWAACFAYVSRRARRKGVPVFFFCHNVVDHESSWWKRRLTCWALTTGSGFFVQSREEMARLLELVPDARIQVQPHPIYDQFPAPSERLPRRAERELLFFGFVRPYKGVDVLLDAVARLAHLDFRLTIAGEVWSDAKALRQRIHDLGLSQRVELIDRFVEPQTMANLFARSDVVVLPYRKATGSGILGLAYRYGKPVIAADVSGLAESVIDGETGLLVAPDSPSSLAAAIAAMSVERSVSMLPRIRELEKTLSWSSLAASVLSFTTAGRPGFFADATQRRDSAHGG